MLYTLLLPDYLDISFSFAWLLQTLLTPAMPLKVRIICSISHSPEDLKSRLLPNYCVLTLGTQGRTFMDIQQNYEFLPGLKGSAHTHSIIHWFISQIFVKCLKEVKYWIGSVHLKTKLV